MDITTLGLAVDSRPVVKAEKDLNSLAAAGARAEKTVTAAASNISKSAEQVAQKTAAAAKATRDSAQAHDAHAVAYRNQQVAAERYLSALRNEAAELGKTRAQVEALRAAQMGLSAEQQRTAMQIGGQIDMLRQQQAQIGGLSGAVAALGPAVAAGFAVERVYAFTKALFDASAAGQRIQTTLDFASGGNGAKELQYVTKLANSLGLELNSTAKAYASMAAASRGTTLEGEGARRVFEAVSKAAAVMGLSTEQSSGALLALQQMISKGTVQSEELRGQLGERLPGAFQTAARAMGVTTAELGKMLEQGLVPASEFLPKFAAQLERELGGSVETAAQRLDASVNRFENAWERLKRAGGDAGVARGFATAADAAAGGFNNLADGIERMTASKSWGEWFNAAIWSQKNLTAEIKDAQEEVDRTSAQLSKAPSNIYFASAAADARAYLAELRAIQTQQNNLSGNNGGGGGRGSVNPQTVAQRNAEREAREAELKAYFEKDIRQTREQKITEDIAKAREANAKLTAKYAGDEATQAKLRASLETEIANIKEKHKVKGSGAATAARDEVNAEIAEFQRGQSVQEEIARRTIANLTAQRAAGAMEEIEYIKAVAAVDAERNAAAETAIQMQIDAAQRKAHNQTQVAQLEGQLAVQREKTLTREQQLQNDLAAVELKRAENARALHNAEMTRSTQELAALTAQNKATQLEIEALGLNDKELQALNESRMDSTIERQRERIAAMEMLDVSGKSADAIELERQKLDELIQSRNLYTSKTNRQRAVDQEQRMYASMWESVDRTAHDVFVNVADDGMNAFERIGKTLKASVLDMLYQMTVRRWLVSIGASITGNGFATAANAATGGQAGGAMNLLGAVGKSPLGSTALGFIGNTGGFGAGVASAASEAALGSAFVGPSASAAGGAVGAGATFGAALPYVGLAIAALSLLSGSFKGETRTGGQFGVAYDGSVTNERRGQTYTYQGQQFDRDFSGGMRTGLTSGQAYRLEGDPVAQESAIRGAVAGTAAGINAMLSALGSKAQLSGFSAGLETSSKGRGGVFSGGRLNTGALFGESGKGDNYAGTLYESTSTQSPDFQTALANFTLDLKQSTLQALQAATDIPKTVRDALANVDIEGLTEQAADALITTISTQIEGVKNLKASFDAMEMPRLAALGFDAAAAMAEVAGGFDKLQANLNSYYQNYYSESERAGILTKQLTEQFAALGFTLPKSREEFRALVQANEALGEGGAKTVAQLLGLEAAFASITPAVADAAEAVRNQGSALVSRLQKSISAEKRLLQDRLSSAQEIESRLNGIFDTLHSNVRDLYGEMDDTRAMQAQQGADFINKALSVAKATGVLPDADKLAEAIAAAREGLNVDNFGGNQAERDYAALVLAGKLSALETVAGKQLTDAQKTVRELENQSKQLDLTLDYWQQQIDLVNGTNQGIASVEQAVRDLIAWQSGTAPGSKPPGGGYGGGGGTASNTPRVGYGADEALTSFEKFKAWYQGLRNNADPSTFMGEGYQVPDWLRLAGTARDGTDAELFGQYQFFKNNSQYAKDFESLYTTGKTNYATDGSTLIKSDLSKMPAEVAAFFKNDPKSLLSYEGMGLDPVLAYQLYQYGPDMFGLDKKKDNFTEWLRNNKWTEGGIVANNNAASFAGMGYSGYNLTRRDLSTGNIIGLDGVIYSNDGKPIGRATQSQLEATYGAGFVAMTGGGQSKLYQSQVGGGASESQYYGAIKSNLDQAIAEGKSAQWIADAIQSTGASLRDVATAYGISVSQLEQNLRNGGATDLPAYQQGTNYVPEDGPAFLHKGEAVIPKEFNPAAGGGAAMGDLGGMLQVAALLASIKDAAEAAADNTERTVELLVSVIDGNAIITAAAPEINIGV